MKKCLILLGALASLSACDRPLSPNAERSDVARYQVVQVGSRTVLLDTVKGQTWELSTDVNGRSQGWSSIKSLN
jgi:hypothetical protein